MMKLDDLGMRVLAFIRKKPNAAPCEILACGIGNSEAQIALIITQLKMFGFI